MNAALIDTSVVIALLKSELDEKSKEVILAKKCFISIIAFLETARYSYLAGWSKKWPEVKKSLESFEIIQLNESISERAATFSNKLALADSIIYATAQENHLTLVTKDKEFKGFDSVILLK